MTASAEQLTIDRFRLDDMLIEQPQLYWEVANGYAMAVSRRDGLKDHCAQVMATVAMRIRTESAKKPTEAAIVQAIEVDGECETAKAAVITAKLAVDELAALKGSYEQRAHMLRDLVQLYITGYFSDDSVRQQQAKVGHQAATVARDRINVKRKALRSNDNDQDARGV